MECLKEWKHIYLSRIGAIDQIVMFPILSPEIKNGILGSATIDVMTNSSAGEVISPFKEAISNELQVLSDLPVSIS